MSMKSLAAAAAILASLASATPVLAQSAGANAEKRQLVTRMLELQRPGIENLANNLAAAPAMQLRQQAGMALQQAVPPERREEVAREIEGDLRKYVDDVAPQVRQRAVTIAPETLGTMLEERFTADELRQLIALLESPVNRKFQSMAGDLQRVIAERLVGDTRGVIEPKVRELERTVAGRLGIQPQPAAGETPRN
jgi:uncharacterized protein